MDDLLHLLHSDGADALQLRAGEPPTVILDGEPKTLIAPLLSDESLERLFHEISTTRQRRDLREGGKLEFLHRFRNRATFVVRVWREDETIRIEIH